MATVEILSEPTPTPRASGRGKVDITVRLIDSKTMEVVGQTTAKAEENERRTREERKY